MVLGSITLGLVSYVTYGSFIKTEHRHAISETIIEHSAHLDVVEYVIQHSTQEFESILNLVKNSNEVTDYIRHPSQETQKAAQLTFQRVIQASHFTQGVMIGDNQGRALFGAMKGEYDILLYGRYAPMSIIWNSVSKYVPQVQEGEFIYSDTFHITPSAQSDYAKTVVGFVSPVFEQGELMYSIGVLIDASYIVNQIERYIDSHPEQIEFYLLDTHDHILFYRGSNNIAPFTEFYDKNLGEDWIHIRDQKMNHKIVDNRHYFYKHFNPFTTQSPYYDQEETFLIGLFSFNEDDIVLLASNVWLRYSFLQPLAALFVTLLSATIGLLFYLNMSSKDLLEVTSLVIEQSQDGVLILDYLDKKILPNVTYERMTHLSKAEIGHQVMNFTTLDGQEFDYRSLLSLTKNRQWQGIGWLHGKRHIALAHITMNVKANRFQKPRYVLGLYSDPRTVGVRSYKEILEDRLRIVEISDEFPLQMLTEYAKKTPNLLLGAIKILNLDVVESGRSLEEHYVIGNVFRERLFEVLDEDSLIFQYAPDSLFVTLKDEQEAYHLLSVLEKPFSIEEREFSLSINIGISTSKVAESSIPTMMMQSRLAIAMLNHNNKCGVLSYSQSLDEEIRRYTTILNDITPALKAKKIDFHYQPIVDISTNKIIALEVLARWNHPTLGDISPAEFIPILEKTPTIISFGRYVIEQSTAFLNSLDAVIPDNNLSVSINISPHELYEPDFILFLTQEIEARNIDPKRFTIELTERFLLEDFVAANKVLEQLHAHHINVAIDDFGTGFSSLKYLHELQVDLLKIDQSFIQHYPEDDDATILKAIVEMAKELRIAVLVEGIETEAQLQLITQCGANSYQGFYRSKALPKKEIISLLQS